MKRNILMIVLIALSVSAYSWTAANGLVINQRFDHNGGTSGYYLGDVAIFGGIIYNQMSKGGYAKFVSDMGSFVICDMASRDIFYTYGKSVKRYKGTLANPYSLTVTPNGDVYAGDIGRDEIQHLSFSGSSLAFRHSVSVNNPLDICYYRDNQGGAGEVYAVSGRDFRIYRFDANLAPVIVNSGLNSFHTRNVPRAVCADAFFVYVLGADAVDWYTKEGGWIKSTPLEEAMDPVDLELDAYGNFLVLDGKGYLHKYFNDSYICTLLSPGTGDDSLNHPNGISIDRPTGLVCVFDDTGLKAYHISAGVFGFRALTGAFVSGPSNISNLIEYSLSGQCSLTLDIRDAGGRIVRTFYNSQFMNPGMNRVIWDGKDYTGAPVMPGRYRVSLVARADYSAFNTDARYLDIDVRENPVTRITYVSTNVLCPQKPFAFIGYTNSEPMDVSLFLNDPDHSRLMENHSGVSSGFFVLDYQTRPVSDGEYSVEISGLNPQGLRCSSFTNIVVNFFPLRFLVQGHTQVFSPVLSNAEILFSISENADVTVLLPGDEVVTNGKMRAGANKIVWNGRDSEGVILPDGLYSLRVRVFQQSVENHETNVIIRIDSTPPVISTSLDHEYISPVDSPGIQDSAIMSCTVNETSELTVRVYDASLNPVALPYQGAIDPTNTGQISWNGKDHVGNPVPDGRYQIDFRVVDLAGNVTLQSRSVIVDNNNENEENRYQFVMSKLGSLRGGEYNIYYSRLQEKFAWFDVPSSSLVIMSDNSVSTNSTILGRSWWTINNLIVSPDEKFFAEFEFSKSSINNEFDSMIRLFDIGTESLFKDYSISLSTFNYIYPVFPFNYSSSNHLGAYFPKTGQIRRLDSASVFHDYAIPSEYLSVNNMSFISYSPDNRYLVWSAPSPFNKTVVFDTRDQTIRQFPYVKNILWLSDKECYALFPDEADEPRLLTKMNIATGETRVENDIGLSSARLADISFDKKKILITDGAAVFLRTEGGIMPVAVFDYINQVVNNVDTRGHSLFFSVDGNSVIVAGIKNGVRGIYRININIREPFNLEAKIDYPSVGIPSIGGMVKIIGSAGDRHFERYTLDWTRVGDVSWNLISERDHQVRQDVLGVLDTASMPDGSNIVIRLTAQDRAGNIRTALTTNKVVNSMGYLLTGVSIDRDYVSSSGAGIRFRLNDMADATVILKDQSGQETAAYQGNGQTGWIHVDISSALNQLADGKIVFTVSATASGKTVNKTGEFILDRNPPHQGFYNPDFMISSASDFLLTGYVNDMNLDYYRLVVNTDFTNTIYKTPIYALDMLRLNREGTNTVELHSVDKAGNSAVNSLRIILDTVPPVCRIDQPIEGQMAGPTLVLRGLISDTMLLKYDVFMNDDLLHSGHSILDGSLTLNTAGYQGTNRLTVKAYDQAGNMAAQSRNILINNAPPVTVMMVNGVPFSNAVVPRWSTNYIGGNAVLDFQAFAGLPGVMVARTLISIDAGPFEPRPYGLHFDQGHHTLSFYSVDSIGNTESPVHAEFMIDREPPSVAMFVSDPSYDAGYGVFVPWNNRIRIDASDGQSGLYGVYYSADGGQSWSVYDMMGDSGLFLTRPGSNTVLYHAVDRVGNASTNRLSVLILDPVPPFTAMNCSGVHFINGENVYYSGLMNFSFQVFDEGSGVSNTLYRLDQGAWVSGPGPVAVNGSKVVEYYSLDRVGNSEAVQTRQFIFDALPPQSRLLVSGIIYTNMTGSVYALPSNSYKILSSDELSGLSGIRISVNGAEWGGGTNPFQLHQETNFIEYDAVDNLSNREETREHRIIVDGAPPESDLAVSNGTMMLSDGRIYCQPGSMLYIRAEDGLSGVRSSVLYHNGHWISNSVIAVENNSTNLIEYYSVDHLGNREELRSAAVISPLPDTTPPVAKLTYQGVTYSSGGLLFGNSGLIAILQAQDPPNESGYASGVAGVYCRINGIPHERSGDQMICPLNPGNNTMEFYALDRIGLSSPTNTAIVWIDEESPVTVSDYTFTGWTNDSLRMVFSAIDRPSGTNSGVLTTLVDSGTGFLPANSIIHVEEGVSHIDFYSIDHVSNVENVHRQTIRIDKTSPLVYVSGFREGGIYNQRGVTLTAGTADRLSGLSLYRIHLTLNQQTVFLFETNLDGTASWQQQDMTVTNHGDYQMVLEVSDIAGNMTIQGHSFTIDSIPPSTPANLRHLFDGQAVFVEWDPVYDIMPVAYRIYFSDNDFWEITNTWLIDYPPSGTVRSYRVSAVDIAGNESLKSGPDTVFIDKSLSFRHPVTNVFFRDRLWLRAEYNRTAYRDPLEWENQMKSEFEADGADDEILIVEIEDRAQRTNFAASKRRPNLDQVALNFAYSNSLVPKYFMNLAEKNKIHDLFVKVLKLNEWQEGPHVLRITGSEDQSKKLEDAVWFGVDGTPPRTYIVVDGMVLFNHYGRNQIRLRDGAKLTLKSIDPAVNGVSSGVGGTFYSLTSKNTNIVWKQYQGEVISLSPGKYVLKTQSVDRSRLLFQNLDVFNREKMNVCEIQVGATHDPDSGSADTNDITPPMINVTGVSDYSEINKGSTLSWQVWDSRCSSPVIAARLNGKTVVSPVQVDKKGSYRLRIEASDFSGNTAVRDIVFQVE